VIIILINYVVTFSFLGIIIIILLYYKNTVHDTSKTAKITGFILVLHWAMDVIYDFYYIHGPMQY